MSSLSPYELQRLATMADNRAQLVALGLAEPLIGKPPRRKKRPREKPAPPAARVTRSRPAPISEARIREAIHEMAKGKMIKKWPVFRSNVMYDLHKAAMDPANHALIMQNGGVAELKAIVSNTEYLRLPGYQKGYATKHFEWEKMHAACALQRLGAITDDELYHLAEESGLCAYVGGFGYHRMLHLYNNCGHGAFGRDAVNLARSWEARRCTAQRVYLQLAGVGTWPSRVRYV